MGGIEKPLIPTTGSTPAEQRFRRAVNEIVDAFLRSGAVLFRSRPGNVLRPSAGPMALGYETLNRVDVGTGSGIAQLPEIRSTWIGSPLRVCTVASGLVRVMTAKRATDNSRAPLVDGSASGVDIRGAGLTEFVTDGTDWFSQTGGDGTAASSASVSSGAVGEIQLHDTTHNPVALYQFTNDIRDYSGNNNHLSVETGIVNFGAMTQRLRGLRFDNTRLTCTPAPTMLMLRDNMSAMFLGMFEDSATTGIFFTHTAGSIDTDANQNYLYQMSADAPRDAVWFSEHGVGVNDRFQPTLLTLPPAGQPFWLGATRINDRVQFYLNGATYGTLSPTLFKPVGGEVGRLFVGGQGGSGTQLAFKNFVMASLKLVGTGLSAADMRAEYSRTLGPFMGTQY